MVKRVLILVTLLMLVFGTCWADDGDGWYLFNKYKYNTATNVPKLPFSHLERIYVRDFDINDLERLSNLKEINNGMSYTIHGEEHGDIVIPVNTNKTLEILNIETNLVKQFTLLSDIKDKCNINDYQWNLIRQEKIDIGFTSQMVVLAKGFPDNTNTSRTSQGTIDIMWYYWGYVVLVNNYVTNINT